MSAPNDKPSSQGDCDERANCRVNEHYIGRTVIMSAPDDWYTCRKKDRGHLSALPSTKYPGSVAGPHKADLPHVFGKPSQVPLPFLVQTNVVIDNCY